MKATTLYLAVLALVGFLYLSSKDYEAEVESARIEQQLRQQAKLEQTADSLGLTGQDWMDYVNGED